MYTNVRDIIKFTPASSMINSYQTAQSEVQEAIRLLKQAKARLSIAFGECHVRILSNNFREYDLDRQAKESLENIRRNA